MDPSASSSQQNEAAIAQAISDPFGTHRRIAQNAKRRIPTAPRYPVAASGGDGMDTAAAMDAMNHQKQNQSSGNQIGTGLLKKFLGTGTGAGAMSIGSMSGPGAVGSNTLLMNEGGGLVPVTGGFSGSGGASGAGGAGGLSSWLSGAAGSFTGGGWLAGSASVGSGWEGMLSTVGTYLGWAYLGYHAIKGGNPGGWSDALKGAGAGAGAGTAFDEFGPWGTIIGAIVGFIGGYFGWW